VALCVNKGGAAGRAAVPPLNLREIDMTRRPWYRAVSREKRSALTPPYESLTEGELVFTVASPMLNREGQFAGVLGADINVNGWTRI
jgi:hypothetical protein